MLAVAKELELKLPHSIDEQKKLFLLTHPLENLGMVLGKFRMAQTLLYNYATLERLAYETVKEAALENTKILELRYAPTFIQEGHPHLSWDDIHQAFLRGIAKAKAEEDIGVGLIIIIQRTRSPQTAESIVDFAITHKDSVVGMDLADNENGFDAKPFEKAFARAKAAGLHITIHAGEVPSQQSIINIKESILRLGAERIGHGIQAIKDPAVLKLLRAQKIPLEVCPSSNYLTQIVNPLTKHPLRALFEAGILLTISTDDPGIFDYTLTQELEVVHGLLGFSKDELRLFQKTAFQHSFLADYEKQKFLTLFEDV